QLAEATDYPTVDVDIDRVRAGQLGISVDQIAASVADATSSSLLINPNFWIDPKTGVPYRVGVFVPEHLMRSAADLRHLPVMPDGAPGPLIDDVASVVAAKSSGQIDHINNQRTLSVVANIEGNDLGRAATAIEQAVAAVGAPPRGVTVATRGQIEQMLSTLA